MAGESRELKFKLALEYDAGGLSQFRSDVESVTVAAKGASGDLDGLASSLTGVVSEGESAAGVLADFDAGGLSDAASGADDLSVSLADVASGADDAGGSLSGVDGGGLGDAASEADELSGSLASVAGGADDASASLSSIDAAGMADIGAAASDAGTSLADSSDRARDFALALGGIGAAALGMEAVERGVARIGGALRAPIDAALELGATFDSAFDSIQLKTGAAGDELAGLQQNFRNVFAQVPASAEDVSAAVGVLNSKLGLTGPELDDLSTQVLNFARITEQDAGPAAESVATIFQRWNVDTENQAGALDLIFKASQAAGVGADVLTASVAQNSVQLQAAGLDLEHAVALMGGLASAGIDAGEVVPGLTRALNDMAKNGIEPTQGLADLFAQIQEEGPNSATAVEAFGKSGLKLAAAISSGALSTEEFLAEMQGIPLGINDAAAATDDYGQGLQLLQNQLSLMLEPIGEFAMGAAGGLVSVAGGIGALGQGVQGASALVGPFTALLSQSGGAAGLLTTTMSTLGSVGSSSLGSLVAAAGPIGVVAAVLGTLYLAVQQANSALDEQLGALDKSNAGFDDYAQAVAQAREQSGLLGKIGFEVKDAQAALGDEVTEANAGYRLAGELIGDLWSAVGGGEEATDAAADGLDKTSKAAKVAADDLILASQAWLEQGTNIEPAVLASDQFTLSQARLNQELRADKLSADEYQAALLEAANAASQAQGAGAVLTAQQQQVEASFSSTLQTLAESSGVLSSAILATDGYAQKQDELAQAVATGGLSAEAASDQWQTYIGQLAASDTTAQKALAANQALAGGFADLQSQLDAGDISFQGALAGLQSLGQQAGATGEQMGTMTAALQDTALSDTLQGFGVGLDFGTIIDPEKLTKAIDEARATANSSIQQLFSEQLQARHEFQAQEQAIAAERGPAIAKAEADAATKIAAARAAGGDNVEQKVADLQAGLAQEVAAINTGNSEKLSALQAGFEQERQARLTALAQAALDQVNSMLSLGQISEDQAQVIFGSLKEAAPDSHLFDPAAEAAMRFSAVLGQATSGNVEAAVGLGDALRGVDDALTQSEAKAGEYEAASVVAYQSAREAVESSASGAITAADIEGEANQRRIDSHFEVDATIIESVSVRGVARQTDTDSSLASTDAELSDNERRKVSLSETAAVTEGEFGRMSSAHTSAAGVSKSASDDMVGNTQRIAGEAQATAGVVDQSVGRIGGTFMTSAAGVKTGTDGIITNVSAANQSLSGLGTGVPSSLAPATDSVLKLRGGVQLLADDVDEASRIQISAQDDAARAATGASDDTVEGFSAVQEQGVDTREEIVALRTEMEQLPKRIDIPLTVTGIKETQAAFASLEKDIEALQTVATIRIYGEYIPKNAPMQPGGSLQLQHDIEDAISAADPGVYLTGTYDGTGPLAWEDGSLAITDAITGLRELTDGPITLAMQIDIPPEFARLLFDPDAEGAQRIRDLAGAIVEASAKLAQAELAAGIFDEGREGALRLAEAISRITGAMDSWFASSKQVAGSLQATLALMTGGGMQPVSEGSFLNSLGFDAASFAELHAQIAALDGEPERQREMWKSVVDALLEDWGRFYDSQKTQLENQKKALEDQKKAAGPDANTDALDAQIETVEGSLAALDERNHSIAEGLSLQGDGLDRMMEAYSRVADEQERLTRAEEEARRAREAAIKALQDDIKLRSKAAEDAEKGAHDQAMDLLDDEVKRRDRANKLEMKALDDKKKRLEADIKAQNEAEEKAHEGRLAAITAEVDKQQKFLDIQEEQLSRAKLIIDSIRAGNVATGEQQDFLRRMGIDPTTLIKANAELAKTETEIDRLTNSIEALSGLFGKLPDEIGRVRLAAGKLQGEFGRRPGSEGPQIAAVTDAERARLEDLSKSGTLSKADQRIVDLALAGREVQAQRLRGILGPIIEAEEGQLETKQKAVDLAKQEADEAGRLLASREAALKLAQHDNDVKREGLQGQIDGENLAFENFKVAQAARVTAIQEEISAKKEAYDAEREAISEAKEAEEDRHQARMRAIDEEYALQLLRAGKTDDEVQKILAEQKERAAAIAAEAERRFNEIMANAAAAQTPVVGAPAEGPRAPGIKTPAPPAPGTPVLPGDPGRGIKGPRPLGLGGDTEALVPIGDMFEGLPLALSQLRDVEAKALDISGLFARAPGLGEAFATRDVSIDRRVIFNGPVTIDRDLAEEIGLVDAARLGAP